MVTDMRSFILRIDYDRALRESVRAGRYDYVDPYVTPANFPAKEHGSREVRLALAELGEVMTTAEVFERHRALGLRRATIVELLALGEAFPNLQREFPIIAFGSSCVDGPEGSASVPALRSKPDGRRELYLDWTEYRWDGACRILGIVA